MAQLRKRNSDFKNNASSLKEVDLKNTIPKPLSFFKEHKDNKIFDDLKNPTYWKNLKRDIEENQGIENPVICFKDGTLIEGHSRIKILKELVEEGKIPKSYKVPTLYFKGTKKEGNKRLILGNLNRFEIPFSKRIQLWKELGYFGEGDTVSPPFTNKELSEILNLSERQVQRVKAILREVEEPTTSRGDTVSPPPTLTPEEEEIRIQEVIKKQNEKRKDNQSKTPSNTSQNPPSKVSKPSPTQDKAERIKELKTEKKRLENLLKEVEQELKKLGA